MQLRTGNSLSAQIVSPTVTLRPLRTFSSATKSRGRAGAEMTARYRHTCAHCGTYTRILPVPVRLFWVNRQARLARARQFSSVRIGRVKLASLCLTFAGSALLCRLPIGLAWGQSGDLRLQLLTVCLDSTVVHSQSDLSWSQAPETVGRVAAADGPPTLIQRGHQKEQLYVKGIPTR